jgi:hypothetical protein
MEYSEETKKKLRKIDLQFYGSMFGLFLLSLFLFATFSIPYIDKALETQKQFEVDNAVMRYELSVSIKVIETLRTKIRKLSTHADEKVSALVTYSDSLENILKDWEKDLTIPPSGTKITVKEESQ